jgi:hypothetical protein
MTLQGVASGKAELPVTVVIPLGAVRVRRPRTCPLPLVALARSNTSARPASSLLSGGFGGGAARNARILWLTSNAYLTVKPPCP